MDASAAAVQLLDQQFVHLVRVCYPAPADRRPPAHDDIVAAQTLTPATLQWHKQFVDFAEWGREGREPGGEAFAIVVTAVCYGVVDETAVYRAVIVIVSGSDGRAGGWK